MEKKPELKSRVRKNNSTDNTNSKVVSENIRDDFFYLELTMYQESNSVVNLSHEEEIPHPLKSERNLLAAILSRAICDAFNITPTERWIVRSARQWLFGPLTPKNSFSFAWVAMQLDLSPAGLQEILRGYEGNREVLTKMVSILK